MEWITNGKNILIVYYEEFRKKDNLIPTLERIVHFMNFTVPRDRLNCVSKHRKGKFYQNAKCVTKKQNPASQNNDYIYSKKHIKWINSAIRKVRKAIKRQGSDDTHLRAYENTNIKLSYCSENQM